MNTSRWIGTIVVNPEGSILLGKYKDGFWGILGGRPENDNDQDMAIAMQKIFKKGKYAITNPQGMNIAFKKFLPQYGKHCVIYTTQLWNVREDSSSPDLQIMDTAFFSLQQLKNLKIFEMDKMILSEIIQNKLIHS